MGLETGTYIDSLDETNPASGDSPTQGYQHLQLIKSTLGATFPNIDGAVTVTQANINTLSSSSTNIQTQLAGKQDSLSIVSQAEAQAGTATTARLWTAERVADAIGDVPTLAGFLSTGELDEYTGSLNSSALYSANSTYYIDKDSVTNAPADVSTHSILETRVYWSYAVQTIRSAYNDNPMTWARAKTSSTDWEPWIKIEDFTSGYQAPEILGGGTPSSANFLRGDGSWAAPEVADGAITSVKLATANTGSTKSIAGYATWTPSAGWYLAALTDSSDEIHMLESDDTSWSTCSYQGRFYMFFTDGTNVRIKNDSSGTRQLEYRKLD